MTKEPSGNITEQLTLQQNGNTVTGTLKNDKGETPVSGDITGSILHLEVTAGDQKYQIHATVEPDGLDGTIRIGKAEYIWSAMKSK